MKVAVVGAGAWGTTVASLLAAKADTTIWAREPDVAEAITERHVNPVFLPDAALAPTLRAVGDLPAAVAGADLVVMAVPSKFFRRVAEVARPSIGATTPVVSLVKGIESGSLLRMSEVLTEVLDGHDPSRIGVMSGPNIAREVFAGQPAATVVAIPDEPVGIEIQRLVSTPTLRVYTNPDVIGCEIGGAVKNVIALAAGMSAGLGYGHNTLAALVTRGLAELTRLGVALGGQSLTFLGLAGIGDLVVTCHCGDSRNRRVGEALATGQPLHEIVASMSAVAEGVGSCDPVVDLGKRAGIELPICEQVQAVLTGATSVVDAVAALLQRAPTAELHGIG